MRATARHGGHSASYKLFHQLEKAKEQQILLDQSFKELEATTKKQEKIKEEIEEKEVRDTIIASHAVFSLNKIEIT